MNKPFTPSQIVVSTMGHDKGRAYIVVMSAGKDFVLVTDGDKRPLENPKLKRCKHLRYAGEADLGPISDSAVRKYLKGFFKKLKAETPHGDETPPKS